MLRRRSQIFRQLMHCTSLKGARQRSLSLFNVQKIPYSRVCDIPSRKSVRVYFLGKLLFLRNDRKRMRGNARKLKPIPAADLLGRVDDCVARCRIEVESNKGPSIHLHSYCYIKTIMFIAFMHSKSAHKISPSPQLLQDPSTQKSVK